MRPTDQLEELIERAEARYGVVVATREATRIVKSRNTLERAIEKGDIVPLGRRGGIGERTFATADLIRFMAMPPTGEPTNRPPPPMRTRKVVAIAEVDAAMVELRAIAGGQR